MKNSIRILTIGLICLPLITIGLEVNKICYFYDTLLIEWQKSCLNNLNNEISYNKIKNDTLLIDLFTHCKEQIKNTNFIKEYFNTKSSEIILQSKESFFIMRKITGEQVKIEYYILTFENNDFYLYQSFDKENYKKSIINKSIFYSTDSLFRKLEITQCQTYDIGLIIISHFNNNNSEISSKVFPIICSLQLGDILKIISCKIW